MLLPCETVRTTARRTAGRTADGHHDRCHHLHDVLPARLRELARDLTTAGLLGHHTRHLGMGSAQLAEEAILPEPLVTAWLGGAPVTPSQLLRCAPALQLSEDVLLAALEGKQDTEFWPLPVPQPDQQGRPE
ncbi:hypothetical protein [Streptomyces sp. NPDC057199]|uniref:hypothetical protein n=1 Tax=Streptomyces sp. NPDC057199 TaxID=3346047 RepID=UPI00362AE6A0